jgi:serine/threonine-protein kinase TTK/MPS1
MVYGHTPFQSLNPIQKIQAIVDPTHMIAFPKSKNAHLVDVMKGCLQRKPDERPRITELLDHAFLHPERSLNRVNEDDAQLAAQVPLPPPPPPLPAPDQLGKQFVGLTADQLVLLLQQAASGNLDMSPRRMAMNVIQRKLQVSAPQTEAAAMYEDKV